MSRRRRPLLQSSRFARCFRRTMSMYERGTNPDLDRDREAVRTNLAQPEPCDGRDSDWESDEDRRSSVRSAATMITFCVKRWQTIRQRVFSRNLLIVLNEG